MSDNHNIIPARAETCPGDAFTRHGCWCYQTALPPSRKPRPTIPPYFTWEVSATSHSRGEDHHPRLIPALGSGAPFLADERGPSPSIPPKPSHAHGRRRAFSLPSDDKPPNGRGDDLPRPRTVWIAFSSSSRGRGRENLRALLDPLLPDGRVPH